jgi:LacI family transcriptional regulator
MRQRRESEVLAPTGSRLEDIIDTNHALARLSAAVDWRLIESHLGQTERDTISGRPSLPRLVAGLSLLRLLYALPDEQLADRWLENPYHQHFCGEECFQHHLPFDRTEILKALCRMDTGKTRALLWANLSAAIGMATIEMADLARVGGIDTKRLSDELDIAARKPGRPERRTGENQRPVSIYDVAKQAGVSIKTVSLVINRQPNVSAQTRSAVLSAIKAMSYRPNVFARGLASERSYLIGMLYDNPPGSYIADLQFGALDRCRQEGYHLIVELLPPQDADPRQRGRALVSESVLHGVILTPPLCDVPEVIDELRKTQTPFVRIAPGTKIPGTPSIGIDEYQAAHEMTDYLIGLGHRRIGFVKGIPTHIATHARLDGYRAALAGAGIPFEEELCAQGMFSYQSGLAAGEYLLSLKRRPTAIFAGNDDMAAGVLAVSQRFQLKIPGELSLVGFDDSLVAQVVWPRLTTCRQPVREMAAAAVSILVQRDGSAQLERHLGHEIIVRESSAPPAS